MSEVLKLEVARKQTPPLTPGEARAAAARLQAAVLTALDEVDIGEIVRAQVEKAKRGDSAAAKTVFALVAAASRLERPAGGRCREVVRALGPDATFEQVRRHLEEDGAGCSEEEYRTEWQQLFGGTDERGRRLKPPAIGKGGGA